MSVINTLFGWLIAENNVIPLVNNFTGLKSKGVVKTTCPRFSVTQVFVGLIVQRIRNPLTSSIVKT